MKIRIRLAVLMSAMLPAVVLSAGTPVHADAGTGVDSTQAQAHELAVQWIVDRADSICGLDDPKMLSKPAKVDYDAVLRATPEMRKMRDDKIDPASSEGIQLRQSAADRALKACDRVRQAQGHCSVWKAIRHQDGRAIADVTDLVKAQL